MPSAGFEPAIPASEQTQVLDHATTGIGSCCVIYWVSYTTTLLLVCWEAWTVVVTMRGAVGELEVAWRPWNASVQLNSSSPHSASFTYRQSSARQSDWRFKSWLQLQAYHDSSFQKPPNIESLVYVYVVSVLWSPSSRQLTQLMPVDAVKDAVFGLRWKKLHESLRRQDLESGHAGFKIWPLKAYSDDSHGFHSFFDFHEKRPYPFRSDPSLTKHPATSLAGLVFQPYTAIISTEHQINRPANHKLNHSIGRSTA